MGKQKHLVLAAVYELMDQNRDEGVGNFQTLKKLHRIDGTYTFISKYSARHHLFNELKEVADWKESAVTVANQVIQFNLIEDDIITSPELDAFGYMFTLGGNDAAALTRKGAVGLTDIVSLEPYAGDSAFYANHDMVQRARARGQDTNPDPYGKEEHLSLYKGGMTINLNRLGVDEWVSGLVEFDNEESTLKISIQTKAFSISEKNPKDNKLDEFLSKKLKHIESLYKVKEPDSNRKEEYYFALSRKDENGFYHMLLIKKDNRNYKVKENFVSRIKPKEVSKQLVFSLKEKVIKVKEISEEEFRKNTMNSDKYEHLLEDKKFFKDLRENSNGYIVYGKIRGSDRYKVLFVLDREKLKERVKELLETYINGFKFQVGGRDYAMVPVFCAVAITKSPLQVFFPNIGITSLGNSRFEITGLVAPIANSKVEKAYLGWTEDKVRANKDVLENKVGNKLARNADSEIINLCEAVDKKQIIEQILSELGF